MVQLACETDFVAKTDQFQISIAQILETIHAQKDLRIVGAQSSDLDYLKQLSSQVKLLASLDNSISSQTMEEGIKYTISKTQENCQLVKVFKSSWNPDEGEALQAYVHAQTAKGSGIGKIGSVIHLAREDKKKHEQLDAMANQLAMHIAAMKPTYLKREDIPAEVEQEILDGENGERALKKYIKRDVLWEQELATAEKSETVGKFLSSQGKQMGSKILVNDWALFVV